MNEYTVTKIIWNINLVEVDPLIAHVFAYSVGYLTDIYKLIYNYNKKKIISNAED